MLDLNCFSSGSLTSLTCKMGVYKKDQSAKAAVKTRWVDVLRAAPEIEVNAGSFISHTHRLISIILQNLHHDLAR